MPSRYSSCRARYHIHFDLNIFFFFFFFSIRSRARFEGNVPLTDFLSFFHLKFLTKFRCFFYPSSPPNSSSANETMSSSFSVICLFYFETPLFIIEVVARGNKFELSNFYANHRFNSSDRNWIGLAPNPPFRYKIPSIDL